MKIKNILIIFAMSVIGLTSCKTDNCNENPFFSDFGTYLEAPAFDKIKNEHYKPAFIEGMKQQKAEIEVEKQKEVARIEAEKQFAVAEVQKKTEAEKLEAIKLQAEQKVATAEAKKKEIELSGAITEQERVKLEIDKETKIGVAKAYADGIGKMKLPTVMASGNGVGGAENALMTFFQLKNAAAALELTGEKVPSAKVK